MASKQTLSKVMLILTQAFPSNKIEGGTVAVYNKALIDIADHALVIAAQECIANCKFFPTVAEIRDRAYQHESRAMDLPSPEEAWAEVQNQARKVGNYGFPTFSHDIIREALYAVGGWYHICVEANHEVVRPQYMRIYQSMLNRRKSDLMTLSETRAFIDERRRQLQKEKPTALPESRPVDENQLGYLIKGLSGKLKA